VDRVIRNTDSVYPHVRVDKYVVMPNHIHLLLIINTTGDGTTGDGTTGDGTTGDAGHSAQRSVEETDPAGGAVGGRNVTGGTVVRGIKTLTTKEAGKAIWQERYHDHIIRNERDYLRHWQYIEDNPRKWAEDEYFMSPM
jgi:REP element-mobilizing transposase RayT